VQQIAYLGQFLAKKVNKYGRFQRCRFPRTPLGKHWGSSQAGAISAAGSLMRRCVPSNINKIATR
jgi:hypothetical protein